jgi:CO dehydrogenase/acetyl-CoA synthase alpha subunit
MILNTLVVAVPVVIGTIIAILAVIALRKYLREKKKDRSEK